MLALLRRLLEVMGLYLITLEAIETERLFICALMLGRFCSYSCFDFRGFKTVLYLMCWVGRVFVCIFETSFVYFGLMIFSDYRGSSVIILVNKPSTLVYNLSRELFYSSSALISLEEMVPGTLRLIFLAVFKRGRSNLFVIPPEFMLASTDAE